MSFNESLPKFYSSWAPGYAEQFANELDYKPRDRELLQNLVETHRSGLMCDLGCGVGHLSRFLADRGARVEGIDISAGMVEFAAAAHPDIVFREGSFFDVPVPDERYDAVIAFYSLIHAARESLPFAFVEIHRILKPGGSLLAAFHAGDTFIEKDGVIFNFFTREQLVEAVGMSELQIVDILQRASYPEEGGEHDRLYLTARRPA